MTRPSQDITFSAHGATFVAHGHDVETAIATGGQIKDDVALAAAHRARGRFLTLRDYSP
ncbi:MAG: hypothetical protein ABI452_01675 [Candidatus Limnocylindrales bacterium]